MFNSHLVQVQIQKQPYSFLITQRCFLTRLRLWPHFLCWAGAGSMVSLFLSHHDNLMKGDSRENEVNEWSVYFYVAHFTVLHHNGVWINLKYKLKKFFFYISEEKVVVFAHGNLATIMFYVEYSLRLSVLLLVVAKVFWWLNVLKGFFTCHRSTFQWRVLKGIFSVIWRTFFPIHRTFCTMERLMNDKSSSWKHCCQ